MARAVLLTLALAAVLLALFTLPAQAISRQRLHGLFRQNAHLSAASRTEAANEALVEGVLKLDEQLQGDSLVDSELDSELEQLMQASSELEHGVEAEVERSYGSVQLSQLVPDSYCILSQALPGTHYLANANPPADYPVPARRQLVEPADAARNPCVALAPLQNANQQQLQDRAVENNVRAAKCRKRMYAALEAATTHSGFKGKQDSLSIAGNDGDIAVSTNWVKFKGYTATGRVVVEHVPGGDQALQHWQAHETFTQLADRNVLALAAAATASMANNPINPWFNGVVLSRVQVLRIPNNKAFRGLICPRVRVDGDYTNDRLMHELVYGARFGGNGQRGYTTLPSRDAVYASFGYVPGNVQLQAGWTVRQRYDAYAAARNQRLAIHARNAQHPNARTEQERLAFTLYWYLENFTVRDVKLNTILERLQKPYQGARTPLSIVGGAIRDMLMEPAGVNDVDLSVSLPYSTIDMRLNDLFSSFGVSLNTASHKNSGKRAQWGMLKVEHIVRAAGESGTMAELLEKDGLDVGPFKSYKIDEILQLSLNTYPILNNAVNPLRHTDINNARADVASRAAAKENEKTLLLGDIIAEDISAKYIFGFSYQRDAAYRDYSVNAVFVEYCGTTPGCESRLIDVIRADAAPLPPPAPLAGGLNQLNAAVNGIAPLAHGTPVGMYDLINSWSRRAGTVDEYLHDYGAHFRVWKMTQKQYCPSLPNDVTITCEEIWRRIRGFWLKAYTGGLDAGINLGNPKPVFNNNNNQFAVGAAGTRYPYADVPGDADTFRAARQADFDDFWTAEQFRINHNQEYLEWTADLKLADINDVYITLRKKLFKGDDVHVHQFVTTAQKIWFEISRMQDAAGPLAAPSAQDSVSTPRCWQVWSRLFRLLARLENEVLRGADIDMETPSRLQNFVDAVKGSPFLAAGIRDPSTCPAFAAPIHYDANTRQMTCARAGAGQAVWMKEHQPRNNIPNQFTAVAPPRVQARPAGLPNGNQHEWIFPHSANVNPVAMDVTRIQPQSCIYWLPPQNAFYF